MPAGAMPVLQGHVGASDANPRAWVVQRVLSQLTVEENEAMLEQYRAAGLIPGGAAEPVMAGEAE